MDPVAVLERALKLCLKHTFIYVIRVIFLDEMLLHVCNLTSESVSHCVDFALS